MGISRCDRWSPSSVLASLVLWLLASESPAQSGRRSLDLIVDPEGRMLMIDQAHSGILRTKDGQLHRVLMPPVKEPRYPRAEGEFFANGQRLILARPENPVEIWNLEEPHHPRRVRVIKTPAEEKSVWQPDMVVLTPDGKTALIRRMEYRQEKSHFRLFRTTTDDDADTPIEEILGLPFMTRLLLSADGKRLIVADGYAQDIKTNDNFTGFGIYEYPSLKEIRRIDYGHGFPVAISITPDGKWIAAGGGNSVPTPLGDRQVSGLMKIFNADTGECVLTRYEHPNDFVKFLTFSRDGKRLFVIDTEPSRQKLIALTTATWEEEFSVSALAWPNHGALSAAPDGKSLLLRSGREAEFVVLNAATGKEEGRLKMPEAKE